MIRNLTGVAISVVPKSCKLGTTDLDAAPPQTIANRVAALPRRYRRKIDRDAKAALRRYKKA